jgi:hypothetical protein
MSKVILATACDPFYITTFVGRDYLESISKHSQADNRFYMVHPTFNDYLKPSNITYKNLDPTIFKRPNTNNCIQHGEFLELDSFNPDDIIIFTDCDMMMQRWFYDDELELLNGLRQDEILLARNNSLTGWKTDQLDNLYEEFKNLSSSPFEAVLEALGENNSVADLKCYNTGVIICRFATYRRWFHLYLAIQPLVSHCFLHYAAQQWILCYLANKCFKVLPLSKHIHMHTIGKLSDETLFKDGVIYMPDSNGIRPVVFMHHFFHFFNI